MPVQTANNTNSDWFQAPIKGEGPKAFNAFVYYRDLPPDQRSIDAAYHSQIAKTGSQQMQDRGKRRAPSWWFDWSRRYLWTARANAADRHRQRLQAEAETAAIQAQAEKWAKRRQEQAEKDFVFGQRLVDKALKMLQFPLEAVDVETYPDGRTKTTINPAGWRLPDLVAVAKLGIDLQRLAAGLEMLSKTQPDSYFHRPGQYNQPEEPRELQTLASRMIESPRASFLAHNLLAELAGVQPLGEEAYADLVGTSTESDQGEAPLPFGWPTDLSPDEPDLEEVEEVEEAQPEPEPEISTQEALLDKLAALTARLKRENGGNQP